MNMMSSTLLNTVVANQTVKSVRNSSGSGFVENKHTRENDRFDMILLFMFGMFLGIGYLFEFSGSNIKDSFLSGFWDCSYLMFCCICQLAVYVVSVDNKQSRRAIKTSLILSSILVATMLIPFIMDMDSIYVHELVAGFGGGEVNGEIHMHYIYRDYTDVDQLMCITIMVIWCLSGTLIPLFKLYRMRNEQK